MDKFLASVTFMVALGIMLLCFPEGAAAILAGFFPALLAVYLISKAPEEKAFLRQVFLIGLILRMVTGTLIYRFDLISMFGGDALTYHDLGWMLLEYIQTGGKAHEWLVGNVLENKGSGWGMYYYAAFVYWIFGHNMLAVQMINCVIGAATAPLIYVCAHKIFTNVRVAKMSAIFVAVFPGMIIWSSQALKDGVIIFCLVVGMVAVIQLREKFSYFALIYLLLSIVGIFSLRFYIFYIVIIAIVGNFVLDTSLKTRALISRLVVLVLVGLTLTYFGVTKLAESQFDRYANVDSLQNSRSAMANEADSGFNGNIDVSTVQGMMTALPIGFIYLMFAPFPWNFTSVRSALTFPEMVVWWCSIPMLVSGIIYTIRYKLKESIAILIFALMLTIAYSIFQGNIGTAYRQRAQVQVFLFMFVSVGWVLMLEKHENVVRAQQQKIRRAKRTPNRNLPLPKSESNVGEGLPTT